MLSEPLWVLQSGLLLGSLAPAGLGEQAFCQRQVALCHLPLQPLVLRDLAEAISLAGGVLTAERDFSLGACSGAGVATPWASLGGRVWETGADFLTGGLGEGETGCGRWGFQAGVQEQVSQAENPGNQATCSCRRSRI